MKTGGFCPDALVSLGAPAPDVACPAANNELQAASSHTRVVTGLVTTAVRHRHRRRVHCHGLPHRPDAVHRSQPVRIAHHGRQVVTVQQAVDVVAVASLLSLPGLGGAVNDRHPNDGVGVGVRVRRAVALSSQQRHDGQRRRHRAVVARTYSP